MILSSGIKAPAWAAAVRGVHELGVAKPIHLQHGSKQRVREGSNPILSRATRKLGRWDMPFTRHATDIISEKICRVTQCEAKKVSQEFPRSGSWVSSFGLCVVFHDRPPVEKRAFALQFIRRIEGAFAEYTAAVGDLSELVQNPGQWSPYFRALNHFEAAISQLYLAYDVGRKVLGRNYFESGDRSDFQRLNVLYNKSEHEIANSDQTLWLTNDGIYCESDSISFAQLEQILRSFGQAANAITASSPD